MSNSCSITTSSNLLVLIVQEIDIRNFSVGVSGIVIEILVIQVVIGTFLEVFTFTEDRVFVDFNNLIEDIDLWLEISVLSIVSGFLFIVISFEIVELSF